MTRPVLLLGAEARVAVAIARSLARRGIPVDVAVFSTAEPRLSSRAIREFFYLPNPQATSEEFIPVLSGLIRTKKYDMLIPISDSSLAACARYFSELSALLHVACPPPPIVEGVLNKHTTLQVAQRCGVPIPPTYCVSRPEELEAQRGSLRFPIIAKPRHKLQPGNFKTYQLKSFEQLEEVARGHPNFLAENLLQEYCSGVGIGIEVLIHRGAPLALFQHRRLKELPATGGVSVLAVSEALDPTLAEQALRMLRELEWEGVAMVEFLYHRDSRSAVLMEINGRYWGSLSLACHAGIDFPLYQWQLAHDERPRVPASYRVGIRARWVTGDLARLHGLFFESASNPPLRRTRWKELLSFITDFRPSTRGMIWSMTDPWPALWEFYREVKKLAVIHLKGWIGKLLPGWLAREIRVYRKLGPQGGPIYLRLRFLRALALRRDGSRKLPPGVRSVLFVCHGNIIRSPMAAALLQRFLPNGERQAISIASAGLLAKVANKADERARSIAGEFGISLGHHRAQLLTREMAEQADVIFVMDFLNEAVLLSRYPHVGQKVFLLAACGDELGRSRWEIADPYDGSTEDVRTCFRTLERHLQPVAQSLFPRA